MISRYNTEDIEAIWSDNSKFTYYLKAELAILKAQEGTNVPQGISKNFKKLQINPQRIHEIEKEVHHDVIAFCTSLTEQLSPDISKYFHYGVTSSDIIDTATSLQIRDSLQILLKDLSKVCNTLWNKSQETKDLLAMGRSHGMFAEPLLFGQKFLGHFCEFFRRFEEIEQDQQDQCRAQFSGACGNYTLLNPDMEKQASDELGLLPEDVSTQVIPRDRYAKILSSTALLSKAIERISIEIRHLHRTEVGEISEGFSANQKGSSTMPHKKNPVSGENLTGISRILTSHLSVALENTLLWHERDISHSSAERLMFPDHFGLLCYALRRLNKTLENLVIHRETISKRVSSSFTYLSSFYLHQLISLTNSTREECYSIVQEASFGAKSSQEFLEILEKKSQCKLPAANEEDLKKIYLPKFENILGKVKINYPLEKLKKYLD